MDGSSHQWDGPSGESGGNQFNQFAGAMMQFLQMQAMQRQRQQEEQNDDDDAWMAPGMDPPDGGATGSSWGNSSNYDDYNRGSDRRGFIHHEHAFQTSESGHAQLAAPAPLLALPASTLLEPGS